MHKTNAVHGSSAIPTNKFFQVCFAPEDEGAGGGAESAFNFAEPTEALTLDKGAAVLAQSMRSERDRDPANGQFARKSDQGQVSDDPENKVVDLKTGKPPEAKAEEPAKEEDEDPEFEISGEEGKEPVRRKLSELWDSFDRATELEKEVETLRGQTSQMPAEIQTTLQQAVQERARYIQALEYTAKLFNPVPPDSNLSNPNHPNYNPDAFWAAQQQYEQSKAAIETIRAEHAAETKKQSEQQKALFDAYMAREQAALKQAWPESQNGETAEKVKSELKSIYGFTDQEIVNTTDHRMFLVVRDALELRALKAKQAEAVKVVRQKPKLVKGAARTTTDPKAAGRSNALRNLAQSGSVDHAVQALKGLI